MRRSGIFRAYAGNKSPSFAVRFVPEGVLSGEAAALRVVFPGVDRAQGKSAEHEDHRTQQGAREKAQTGATLLSEEKTGFFGVRRVLEFLQIQCHLRRLQ